MFGFTPVTDYTRQADLGFKMSQDTATKTKKAMQNISGIVIEKRIAKQYPDAPYGEEALKARVQAYAGIDPERSQQAQKMLQSTYDRNVQQAKISLDKTKFGYDVAKDERDFSYTAQKDTNELAFNKKKEERLGREFEQEQKIKREQLLNESEKIGIKESELSAAEADRRRQSAREKVTADLNKEKFLEAVRAKGVEEGYTEQRLLFEQKKFESDIANGSLVYDTGTGQWFDKRTRKVIDIEGNASARIQTETRPTTGIDYIKARDNALLNRNDADSLLANATGASQSKLAKAQQNTAERNYKETQARLTKIDTQYEPIKTNLEPSLDTVASGRSQLEEIKNSDNPRTLVTNITKLIGRLNQDKRLSNLDFTTALGTGSIIEQLNKGFTRAVGGKLDPDTLASMEDLFDFMEKDTKRAIRTKEWNIIRRDLNSSSYVKEISSLPNVPFTDEQLQKYNNGYFSLLENTPSNKANLDSDYYIHSGLIPPTR